MCCLCVLCLQIKSKVCCVYKMKTTNEWFIEAPWGNIALISWGNPSGMPVLLIHGRQDSAATFVPLLDNLPETFNYVGVDLPGHGRSDPLPKGVMLTRFHFLVAVKYAVKHLKWNKFVYIGHSMGCEQGLFYNLLHPLEITKFIFLDPLPSFQRLQIHDFKEYYEMFYHEYYSNYKRYNHDDRVYSKRKALDTVMRVRGLNEDQANLVLSRNLQMVGEDLYKLESRKVQMIVPLARTFVPKSWMSLHLIEAILGQAAKVPSSSKLPTRLLPPIILEQPPPHAYSVSFKQSRPKE